jgi:hypothetical protein
VAYFTAAEPYIARQARDAYQRLGEVEIGPDREFQFDVPPEATVCLLALHADHLFCDESWWEFRTGEAETRVVLEPELGSMLTLKFEIENATSSERARMVGQRFVVQVERYNDMLWPQPRFATVTNDLELTFRGVRPGVVTLRDIFHESSLGSEEERAPGPAANFLDDFETRTELRARLTSAEHAVETVRLMRLFPTVGRVVGTDGEAVPGAAVWFHSFERADMRDAANVYRASTNRNGDFIVSMPRGASAVTVSVKLSEHYPFQWTGDATLATLPTGKTGHVITLRRRPAWTGIVLNQAGEPVPGARVQLQGILNGTKSSAKAGPDGRFQVVPMGRGPFTLLASAWASPAGGDPPRRLLSAKFEVGIEPLEVEVQLKETPLIEFQAMDDLGEPVSRAKVYSQLVPPGQRADASLPYLHLWNGSKGLDRIIDGVPSIANLPPGVHYVWARTWSRGSRAILVDSAAPPKRVTFVLPRPGSVKVLVRDDQARPVIGARLQLRGQSELRSSLSTASQFSEEPGGAYTLNDVPPGHHEIRVSAARGRDAHVSGIEVLPGECTTIDVDMESAVELRVLMPEKIPYYMNGRRRSLQIHDVRSGEAFKGELSEDNKHQTFRGIPPGEYWLTVPYRGAGSPVRKIVIPDEPFHALDLREPPEQRRTIAGQLTCGDRPMVNHYVQLRIGKCVLETARTDRQGRFQLEAPPVDQVTLRDATTQVEWERELRHGPGVTTLDLALLDNVIWCTPPVTESIGNTQPTLISHREMERYRSGEITAKELSEQATSSGSWIGHRSRFLHVPPGRYVAAFVRASRRASDVVLESSPFDVRADEEQHVNLTWR